MGQETEMRKYLKIASKPATVLQPVKAESAFEGIFSRRSSRSMRFSIKFSKKAWGGIINGEDGRTSKVDIQGCCCFVASNGRVEL